MGHLLWFILVGLVAGWLAGKLVKGGGYGILVDIVVGVIGAVIGGFLFGSIGVSHGGGLFGNLIASMIGAVAFLLLLRQQKRAL
ncbi:MAG: GlsB/YeaQ/YmgE family stress response membrane protein [Planctomycetota bacterium]